jgi:hypothetical protein
MSIQRALGCLYQSGIIGESEVVVGAEVEDSLAIGLDFCELRGGDDAFSLIGACFLHGLDLLCQVLLDELTDLTHNTKIEVK